MPTAAATFPAANIRKVNKMKYETKRREGETGKGVVW